MFSDKYQGKFVTVYHSVGSDPLANWSKCKEGDFQRVQDGDLKSNVLQIQSRNVVACSITTPANPKDSLGIRLPYFTMLVNSLGLHFSFEITILDSENIRRRFRASNFQPATRVSTFACAMPICLADGWNQIQLDLAKFTERTYNTTYAETVRVQVHANCRLKRIYFSDQFYADDQLPNDYRLFATKTVRVKPASTLKKANKSAAKKPKEPPAAAAV